MRATLAAPTLKVRALVLAAAIAAVGSAAFGIAPGSADASPVSSCTSTTGTIVAVDFSHWGGRVVGGCDETPPGSGYDLLHGEGFSTAGDSHDGPAFICRIGNGAYSGGTLYPTVSQDACIVTPPATAYWSYWLAPAGQSTWSYSQFGAMSDVPKAGEVELWVFGGTNVAGTQGGPTCSPDSIRSGSVGHCSPLGSSGGGGTKHSSQPSSSQHATSPTTHAATDPTSHGNPATGSSTPSAAVRSEASSTTSAPGSVATNPAATTGSSTALGAGPAVDDPTESTTGGGGIVDAAPVGRSHHSSGSAAPVIVTLVVIAVLLGGAGYARWRRTRLSTD